MHGWEDDEALIVGFDEAVKRVVLVLVKLDFLPDALQVEHYRRIAHEHLKGYLPQLSEEGNDALVDMRRLVGYAENCLNFAHQPFMNRIGQALRVNGAPVRLVGLPQNVHDRAICQGCRELCNLLESGLDWLEMLFYEVND